MLETNITQFPQRTEWVYKIDPTRRSFNRVPTYKTVRENRPAVIKQIQRLGAQNAQIKSGFILYVAVNRYNNKLYVGRTHGTFIGRMNSHRRSAEKWNSSALFHKAIRKYGWKAFDWHIYGVTYSEEKLNHFEEGLIAAVLPEYNMTSGGGGISGYKRPADVVAKCVAARRANGNNKPMLGHVHSRSTRKKISDNRKGKSCAAKTPETRAKRLELAKRATLKISRPVMCVDDGKAFPHMLAAASHYKIAYSHFQRCIRRNKTANGFLFRFVVP